METLALKLLRCCYSATGTPALNGLLSPNHWHDRNCGYHVTGSYCRLGGIRTFSHRLWTPYIFRESAELRDHSDLAMWRWERIYPLSSTMFTSYSMQQI